MKVLGHYSGMTPPRAPDRRILVVDVGGSHVKVLATGERRRRRFESGPDLTPAETVAGVLDLSADWHYDVVSIGIPTPIRAGRPLREPVNLGPGWVGFDFEAAFGKPTRVVNDAAMQALGSYRGGRMLFLGLGTGLGSAMIVDGVVAPMELGHLPYRKATFEDYVGGAGLKDAGRKRWRKSVDETVALLVAALEPVDVVLGGGNAKNLDVLPPGTRLGGNDNAFAGGFRLWDSEIRLP
jgi:polyphosphate glucokinase